jgi:hypothetical protein
MSRRKKEKGESSRGEGGLWINVTKCTLETNTNNRIIKEQECKKKKSATDDLTDDLTNIETKGRANMKKRSAYATRKPPPPLSPLSLFEP